MPSRPRAVTSRTQVTVVAGPPLSGKNTYVRERWQPGHLIVDVDALHQALSGMASHRHHPTLLPFVFDARDAVIRRLLSGSCDASHAWIITTNTVEAERLGRSLKGSVVELDTPRDECHRRADGDGRPAAWHRYIDEWWDAREARREPSHVSAG